LELENEVEKQLFKDAEQRKKCREELLEKNRSIRVDLPEGLL